MIKTVIYTIYFCSSIILANIFVLPPYLVLKLLGLNKQKDHFMQVVAANWGRLMIWGTGSKVSVTGLENIPPENALFIGNHQSHIDILVILSNIPKQIGFIAKVELARIPVFGLWMRTIHCLFLDRSSFRDAATMVNQGAEHLKNGNSLVVFPEGHRSKGPNMGTFKRGSFKLATRSGTPIVPITISGSYKAFEETGHIRAAQIKLTIHPPINVKEMSDEEIKALSSKIEKQIASAL